MTNLIWLLTALALAAAPHLQRLPLWVGPLCLALGLWRLVLERRGGALPRKDLLFLAALALLAAIFAHYRTLFGRDAGVALLVVMMALKLMEMKTLRDVMVAIFLGYFLVITNFFYSQSIPTAAYLFAVVLITTGAMIGYNHPNGSFPLRARLRLAAVLLAQAVPLLLVLFLLFPRIQGPLWGLPKDAYAGATGLSDTMTPGAISQLIGSDQIAFRVSFQGAPPPKNARYWRGPVLWDFDGHTWSSKRGRVHGPARFTPLGPPVTYIVTLEPHDRRWLFALDLPSSLPPNSRASGDYQLLADKPVRQRLRYTVSSHTRYRFGEAIDDEQRERGLRLPEGSNPRATELARRWHDTLESPPAVVGEALKMFREQPFVYTLNPPLLEGQAVDGFLFGSRRGFCEHYAGAFVFLMRAAGIPARVVTGYQGGEPNPLGDYTMVRQSDAHAWAEVWLDGQGWVRVDPTAAVSPARVESGISAALPATELPPALVQLDATWLRRARLSWDLLNNGWNQWVLGYGQERQSRFLSGIHASLADWTNMAIAMMASVAVLLLATALWMLWRTPQGPADPALAAYLRFCAKLARRGVVRAPQEGPADFAVRASRLRPDLAGPIGRVTRLYVALRYGGRHPAGLPALRRAVGRFRP